MITLDKNTIYIDGEWTLSNLKSIQAAADKFKAHTLNQDKIMIDGSKLQKIDTIGCQELYIALEAIPQSATVDYQNFDKKQIDLYQFIKSRIDDVGVQKTAPSNKCSPIGRIGLFTVSALEEMQKFIEFIGEISTIAIKRAFTPWNIRWSAFWSNIQSAGVMALPIIGLLNFLIGAVIAYQAGNLLRMFGASIYIVDFSAVAV